MGQNLCLYSEDSSHDEWWVHYTNILLLRLSFQGAYPQKSSIFGVERELRDL